MKNKDSNGSKAKLRALVGTLIFMFFAYGFFSCASSEIADSADVNQAKIYQYYSITYDASLSDAYIVEAQFRFGGNKGTTLRLSDPSKILVNDVELDEESNVLRGCYYQTKLENDSKFNFKFIDTEEKEYSNECKLNKVDLKYIDDIIVERGLKIKWLGLPLASNETMTCVIEDEEGNTASVSNDIIGAVSIKFNVEDLQTLIDGNAQIYMYRSSLVDAKESADEGGKIYTEYKTEAIAVKIIRIEKPQV